MLIVSICNRLVYIPSRKDKYGPSSHLKLDDDTRSTVVRSRAAGLLQGAYGTKGTLRPLPIIRGGQRGAACLRTQGGQVTGRCPHCDKDLKMQEKCDACWAVAQKG